MLESDLHYFAKRNPRVRITFTFQEFACPSMHYYFHYLAENYGETVNSRAVLDAE